MPHVRINVLGGFQDLLEGARLKSTEWQGRRPKALRESLDTEPDRVTTATYHKILL